MAKELARTSVEADRELADIATYVCNYRIEEHAAFVAARRCLVDTLACAFVALEHPECAKLLGPIVPGAGLWNGARVPGTRYELDPATAAFNIGALVRWLDLTIRRSARAQTACRFISRMDQVHRELTLSIPPAIHADAKNRPPFSDANSLMR